MARTVELFIDGVWVDVTAEPRYVLTDDPITITRGADSRSSKSSPGSCTLTLYDRDKDGRWSNRVPTSTYWQKLGRNTPIRISVDGDVRAVMEVPTWAPRWEPGDRKVRVPVEAAGILRRLTEGARALKAPLLRAIPITSPVYYWPLSDGSDATQFGSALSGGTPMPIFNSPSLAAVDGPPGDPAKFPDFMSSGAYSGYGLIENLDVADTTWMISGWFRATTTTASDAQAVLAVWNVAVGTFGAVDFILYVARIGSSEGLTLVIDHTSLSATSVSWNGSSVDLLDGNWHQWRVGAIQSGGNVTLTFWVDGSSRDSAVDGTHNTLGHPKRIKVGDPTGEFASGLYTLSNIESLSQAHITIWSDDNPDDHYDAGIGYAGETAGRRVQRLCLEEGIAFASVGDLDNTAPMGPQSVDTLVSVLEECATADQGSLFETRTELGLTYRTRVSLYNQIGPLLDYSAGVILPPLEPVEDNELTHNDVTVSRPGGSSARSTLDIATDLYHTLTTQAPPNGVGTYDRGEIDAVVETDDQLQLLADWIRHRGTWDELRYPTVSVEFVSAELAADPDLSADLAELDTGDQLRMDGLPAWLPPDMVALLVQGSVEGIGTHTRTLTWNVTPGWPWEVWELDSGGSTLVAAVNAAATSLKIATSSGPEWSTVDEPYHIIIDGEAMTVTAMTTDTPAFIAAGTVAHAVNASVTPGLPAGMTPDVGQALFVWVAIRNSGTGTPNTPAGYTKLVDCANAVLFGKYYVTGDAAPTITFAGGVANADTSARMFAFSGMSLELDGGRYNATAVSPQTQLNGSAQNVAYPALSVRRDNSTILFLGWKQDDWTSVATVGDAEIMDNATTTGDDQGIVADYDIQTTATDVASGSFTVTGGASAISRAGVVAFRPLQTATVTRAVNGVSKSIAAAKAVHGWRLGVIAL